MTKTGFMLRDKPRHYSTPMVAHMMTPGVVQVPGDVSVSEAALLLDRERIPCLLVKDSETTFGIMTSADIVKKVVRPGTGAPTTWKSGPSCRSPCIPSNVIRSSMTPPA
jgi:CBS domain-containing protein